MLKEQELTCAFVKDDLVYISKERGVRPLLECYKGKQMEPGFSAADKVVGKAAAFLYVLLGVGEIYTDVISRPALDVLNRAGIDVSYGQLADAIRNRVGTGFCPMETAVMDIQEPDSALAAVEETLAKMKKRGE
ncbi:MAG: DUF1893 domain-containing protein [Lachnospiraceae bacterium]|nr:DUF1893 domain-containing protein [Lachnospiraceae bacterium]